MVRNTYQ